MKRVRGRHKKGARGKNKRCTPERENMVEGKNNGLPLRGRPSKSCFAAAFTQSSLTPTGWRLRVPSKQCAPTLLLYRRSTSTQRGAWHAPSRHVHHVPCFSSCVSILAEVLTFHETFVHTRLAYSSILSRSLTVMAGTGKGQWTTYVVALLVHGVTTATSMTVRGSIHRDTHQHNASLTSAHAEASSSHLVMFNNYNWNGILKCPATGTWGRIFDSQFIGTSLCTRYLASDLGLGSQVDAGALDNQGGILLTDYNNAAIKKCTIDSSPSCESIITGINQPTGVAIDSSGTYFVVTGFTSIFRCVCASPPCSASTSCTEIGTGLFDQPGWIVMHPDGSLVVPDMSPKKIYKCPKDFSSTCTLVYDYDSHYTSWNIEAGPRQVTFDSNGDYIFAQRSWANGAVIKCPSTCEGCSTCTRVAHVVYHAQSVAIDPNGDYIVNEDLLAYATPPTP